MFFLKELLVTIIAAKIHAFVVAIGDVISINKFINTN